MSWEVRGGRRYYYSAKKIDGRTVKTYHGNNGLAVYVANLCEVSSLMIQAQRLQNDATRKEMLDRLYGIQETTQEASTELYRLSVLLLESEGYHRPMRGPWRKRRKAQYTQEQEIMGTFTVPESSSERFAIVSKALGAKSDKALQRQAIACLKAYPNEIGPRVTRCQEAVFQRIADDNDTTYEMFRQAGVKLWAELAGCPSSSEEASRIPKVERLLIDRVVACHFALLRAEQAAGLDSSQIKQREHFGRVVDRLNKQYLAALKTLAQVRRLNLPMIVAVNAPAASQVNVGSQQVNATA